MISGMIFLIKGDGIMVWLIGLCNILFFGIIISVIVVIKSSDMIFVMCKLKCWFLVNVCSFLLLFFCYWFNCGLMILLVIRLLIIVSMIMELVIKY